MERTQLRTSLLKHSCILRLFLPVLAASMLFCGFARAQDWQQDPGLLWQQPSLNFSKLLYSPNVPNLAGPPDQRIRLFRIQPGFLSDPVGLQMDDDLAPPDSYQVLPLGCGPGAGMSRVQASLGIDNPYFDFRSPGDPGGVGYYKFHGQYQLLASQTQGLTLGVQAVAPAGLEADGVEEGRKVISPLLGWYQDLGAGAALQGFVSKNIRANAGWTDQVERGIRYGLALQSPPLPALPPRVGEGGGGGKSDQSVHMFVEALGRVNDADYLGPRARSNWEVLPGLHWQVGENWWMTGGLIVPVGVGRFERAWWQFTWSWRF